MAVYLDSSIIRVKLLLNFLLLIIYLNSLIARIKLSFSESNNNNKLEEEFNKKFDKNKFENIVINYLLAVINL